MTQTRTPADRDIQKDRDRCLIRSLFQTDVIAVWGVEFPVISSSNWSGGYTVLAAGVT
jgi:hypothetical protein